MLEETYNLRGVTPSYMIDWMYNIGWNRPIN